MLQIKDAILTALFSVLLSVVCDDDEVLIDATEKEALEFRFYALFVDTSFIVISDSEVEENKLTITVLKSGNIINDEVLTVCIKAVVIKNNLAATMQAADIEMFMIKIVIEEEVKAVDVETLSMKDKIEVKV